MKKIILLLIELYQRFISYILKNILGVTHFCRFSPTCSEYARINIQKEGILKGLVLSTVRILSQVFFKVSAWVVIYARIEKILARNVKY